MEERETNDSPSRGKVLFMDDNEILRDVVPQMLVKMGYRVGVAADGEEAVSQYKKALAEGSPYQVVILDLKVDKGMNGLDAMRILIREFPGVTVLLSSGHPNDPAMIDHQKYGFKGTIDKPYTKSELEKCLQMYISNSPGGSASG
ncbi:MAG: response regulator [Candidatus Krumholzibacteriota bacterium]|nr:response regulator [Candidatus Krumholzibacteriota bacterium]